jgi:hypothetical protein
MNYLIVVIFLNLEVEIISLQSVASEQQCVAIAKELIAPVRDQIRSFGCLKDVGKTA